MTTERQRTDSLIHHRSSNPAGTDTPSFLSFRKLSAADSPKRSRPGQAESGEVPFPPARSESVQSPRCLPVSYYGEGVSQEFVF